MARYRYIGDDRVVLPDLGLELGPGQEFEVAVDLPNPPFEPVTSGAKSKAADAVPKES